MIDFKPIKPEHKNIYQPYLFDGIQRGCEYSFSNLCLWGRQNATILHDHMVLFSQFNRRSVYPYPVGSGDKKPVLDAIIADAKERGIPCRLTGLNAEARQTLEMLYPGMFRFHCDRDSFDYVYNIDDLADLPGRKYQKKRNHCNRFRTDYPDYAVRPLSEDNITQMKEMINAWYDAKEQENPESDFLMERAALNKALKYYRELEMDGLVLLNGEEILGITMGSRLSSDTYDIQFEKSWGDVNGAYAIINYEFARYLREKYPDIRYLDREEDMGIEGLRIAKERYFPDHMIEKCWAHLMEDGYDY
ncbi:MAG: DUF2156 domain-containing protein [Roseburia sp.]|nr:DUF2156 domain-containing protein [Roseburia sp.]